MPTLTLQRGSATVVDASILSPGPTTNYGTATGDNAGRLSANIARNLIAFDLSQLPANAVISAVSLALYHYNYTYNTATFDLYRVKVPWVETEVTWQSARSGTPWQSAGCSGANDVEAAPIGVGTCPASPYDWFTIAITAAAKSALDLGYGWVIRERNDGVAGNTFKQWYSSDYAGDVTKRPKLTIVYSLPASGAPAVYAATRRMRMT
jgi:hypothetical protein